MEPKVIRDAETAVPKIIAGMKRVADAVVPTLGPRGRNVAYSRGYGAPVVTSDGVTVARQLEFKDRLENIGASLVKEAASNANVTRGDGTTTTSLLAHRMAEQAYKLVTAGVAPIKIKKGMDIAQNNIVQILRNSAVPCETKEDIHRVALLASKNDDQVAEMVSAAMEYAGKEGLVEVGYSDTGESSIDIVEGCRIDRGVSHFWLIPPDANEVVLENPYILILDKKFSNLQEFVPIAEVIAGRPLLIIAEDIEGDVLQTILLNVTKMGVKICCVKSPSYGAQREGILGDLAILTGTTVVSSKLGITTEDIAKGTRQNMEDPDTTDTALGTADKVVIDKETCTIVGGGGFEDQIQDRIQQLRKEATRFPETDFNYAQLMKRASYIEKGLALISVGGKSETEREDKKLRVDDALSAARGAVLGGTVIGGGIALIKAAKAFKKNFLNLIEDEEVRKGAEIVLEACTYPTRCIAYNSGSSGDYVVERILQSDSDTLGYNAEKQELSNLIEDGVIDPVEVVTSAITYSTSVASMVATLGCSVELQEEENESTA